MGLSRNKVAVSEGAAGSPPFYGEQAICREAILRMYLKLEKKLTIDGDSEFKMKLLFNFQGPKVLEKVNSRCYKRRGSTRSHSEHGS